MNVRRNANDNPGAWAWILQEPAFGYAACSGEPKRPTRREAIREVWLCINAFQDMASCVPLVEALFTVWTWLAFVGFFGLSLSWRGILVFIASIAMVGTLTNTFWLHRYCSHRAFRFRHPLIPRVLCWFNGLAVAEDKYAIAHFVHHLRSDKVGDPYGPHLGRLGSYLATSFFSKRLNRQLTPRQYERMTGLVRHVGYPIASYETFLRFGSTEHPLHLGARLLFGQLFWSGFAWVVAGWAGVLGWFAAIAVATVVLRDFNYSGHGGARQRPKIGGWEFDDRTRALNQWFYGLLGAEWHNNHHMYPRSANLHLVRGQIDRAFLVIRSLHWLGVISSYRDDMPRARKCLLSEGVLDTSAPREAQIARPPRWTRMGH
jgi:stearoyl-CoA desaturase (delta-9 desaturase)